VLFGFLSLAALLSAATPALLSAGETCSEATLKGAYGIQMQGTRPAPPQPTEIESVIGVVIRRYDGQGGFTQVDYVKGAISGIVEDSEGEGREGEGTYEVNADCTGATYFDPGSGVTIEERFVIVSAGREVLSIAVKPQPSMVATVQKRIQLP
jgi:hypothetical protein